MELSKHFLQHIYHRFAITSAKQQWQYQTLSKLAKELLKPIFKILNSWISINSILDPKAAKTHVHKFQDIISWTSEQLTANGSACSHEMGAPQDAGLIFSGNDSGTATRIKQISNKAIAVARTTTKLSP